MVNEILSLSLGSLAHLKFSWESLEAKVGKPLSEKDKWLVRRINLATEYLDVFFHENNMISIRLEKEKRQSVKEDLGIPGDSND